MNPRTKSIIALIAVAFGYALLNVASRLMGEGLEPMTQVYLRIGLGCIVASIVFRKQIRIEKIRHLTHRDWLILLFLGTVAYSIGVYFVTMGALNTSVFNVSVIYSTIVFFVYIYSIIFLRSKFNPISLVLIFISFVGIIFISGKLFVPQFGNFGMGEFYTLLAACFMAFFSVGRKMLSKDLNNQEITIITMVIAFISGLIIAVLKGESFPAITDFSVAVLIGLAIGAFFNIVSTFFESYAFEHIDVVLGNQILLLESFFSIIIGVLFYRELPILPQIVGSVLILLSVYISNRKL